MVTLCGVGKRLGAARCQRPRCPVRGLSLAKSVSDSRGDSPCSCDKRVRRTRGSREPQAVGRATRDGGCPVRPSGAGRKNRGGGRG